MDATTSAATKPDKRSAAFENIFGRPKPSQGYDPAQYYASPAASSSGVQQPPQQRLSYQSYGAQSPMGAATPAQSIYALPAGAAAPVGAAGPYGMTTYYQQQVLAPQQQQQYYYQQQPIQQQQHVVAQQPPQHQILTSPMQPYHLQLQPQVSHQYQTSHTPEPLDYRSNGLDQHLLQAYHNRQTMTPAQAYQAQTQVYLNSPMNQPYQQPHPASQPTPSVNSHALPPGAARASYQLPPLPSVELELGMGGLGLSDFAKGSGASADGDDDDDDELSLSAREGNANGTRWSKGLSRTFAPGSSIMILTDATGDPSAGRLSSL